MAKNLTRLPGDLHVPGNLTVGGFDLPEESVTDDNWDPTSPLSTGNQQHRYAIPYHQKHGAAVVSERMPIHVGIGENGTVMGIAAALVIPSTGDSTITVDLYKNGTSILSSIITLDVDNAAFESVIGTPADGDSDYDAGDVFEVVVTATVGTGTLGQGLIVSTIFDEDAA